MDKLLALAKKSVACASALAAIWFVLFPAVFGWPYNLPDAVQPLWASEIEPIKAQQKGMLAGLQSLQATVLEGQILETHARWCAADPRQRESTGWAARLDDLQKQYKALTGERVDHLPLCDRE